MDVLIIVTCALTILIVVAVGVIWLKGPAGLSGRLNGIDARLVEVDRSVRSSSEATLHARESKEATLKLVAEFGEAHGRLAGVMENQQQLGMTVAALRSSMSLQVSEGLLAIRETIAAGQLTFRQEVGERDDRHSRTIGSKIDGGLTSITDAITQLRTETTAALKASGDSLINSMSELRVANDAKLAEIVTRTSESAKSLNDTAQNTVTTVADRLVEVKTAVDATLKAELGAIRTDSNAKLDEMRRTVDEKLHATLEQRLGESFKIVSDRLELVHRGLGEMQSLAVGVGDLKKVLTNVKTRGTWGEVQLHTLLDQILIPDQYERNVATKSGSGARVEFAIRFPGRSDDGVVWLPIDAKFPMADYQRLVEAQERVDVVAVEEASRALEACIKTEAKAIRDKYIDPPHTTDFAILYLPTEGLYAEVLRRPGLADWSQRECKIVISGPTTLAAMLNSLQMGFRTLAIEKRSSEVWTVLGAVKTEFGKFGDALAHTKKKLEEATSSIESAEIRNRVLTRKLRGVDELPPPDAAALLISPVDPGAGDNMADEYAQ